MISEIKKRYNENYHETFGKNLKKFRLEKDLSREKLAELLNVSSRIIADYEDGFKGIRPEKILKLCNILGVTLENLLT